MLEWIPVRTVLRRSGVPYLLATSFVGRLPSSMAALALVRLVVDAGGGYAFGSTVTATYILGGMIGQPVLARVVDRTGRRRPVLVGAAVAATIGFVVTAFTVASLPWLALGAVLVAGLATPPLESVLRSLWTVLFLDPVERNSAYAVDAAVQELAFVIGPLLTAVGILVFGAAGNVFAMAAAGLVGAVAFAAHPRIRRTDPIKPEGAHGSPLLRAPFVRLLILVIAIAAPVGALTINATAYAEMAGDPSISSWAIALNGFGALTGALLTARFPFRAAPERLVRRLGVMMAALYLPTAFFGAPVWLWLTFAAISGLLLPVLLTQVFALTPALVDAHHGNEANAWVISAFAVGNAGGTILTGQILGAAGTSAGITIAAVACGAIGMLGSAQAGRRALRRVDESVA
ncbi:MFS transporter [Microbacterium sp. ASV49]|uniref:MFS transporter n=1 Tax=Microbacterium candidum TaxID=3041922 RepID=A0ABT7MU41_9MICO|nr:MFS transporter [Microbacterium sp. ASV49]MDL9977965.1 MFS transporter [Microbacterium sp. ASV49]